MALTCAHDNVFLQMEWVVEKGGYVHPSIERQELAGRGSSVVATKAITKGEKLFHLPVAALINRQSRAPAEGSQNISTHQLLTEQILASKESWVTSLPTIDAFRGVPLLWAASEIEKLPPKYQEHVERQKAQIQRELKASGSHDFDRFVWAWLCVNSRCLYWANGGMTLAPGIDFLNHTFEPGTVDVKLDAARGMYVYAQRDYKIGDEVCLCYGAHDNGFLMCEYGFLLPEDENPYDCVDITREVMELLPDSTQKLLADCGYLGDYTIDRDGAPSFRVQIALAAKMGRTLAWTQFKDGYNDGKQFASFTENLLRTICEKLIERYTLDSETAPNPELKLLYTNYCTILSRLLGSPTSSGMKS